MPVDVTHYPRYRFPPAIIGHAVWLYYRFTLSLAYARRLRHRAGPVGDTCHLDELSVTIRGQRQYLWRAVDQDGDVIDILLQPRRDRHAAAPVLSTLAHAGRPRPVPPRHRSAWELPRRAPSRHAAGRA
jgi:transposase-like protein